MQPSEVSIYRNLPPANEEEVRNEVKRIHAAFPQAPNQLILIMSQRIVERGLSREQLVDAVNNLIDNFRFPVPTVADIIGFDKKVKLFSHAEVVAMLPKGYEFTDFEKIELNGKIRWTLK